MMKKSIKWIVISAILLLIVLYFDYSEIEKEPSIVLAFEKIEKLSEYNPDKLDSIFVKCLSVLKYQKAILDSTFMTSALTNYKYLFDRKELISTIKDSRKQALNKYDVSNDHYEGFVLATQVYFLKRMDNSIRKKIPWISKLGKYNEKIEQFSNCHSEVVFAAIQRNEREIADYKWFLLITPTPLSGE